MLGRRNQMKPRSHTALVWLYLLNIVFLTVHEMDSAYWHEWELLRLPGGIQFFLILHIPLLGAILLGFWRVVLWEGGAKLFSYTVAGIGIGAVALHTTLLLAGNPEFRQPTSLMVLAGVLVVSCLQIFTTYRSPARIE
jgi:hypothetical protein